jgi:hypothetical protein
MGVTAYGQFDFDHFAAEVAQETPRIGAGYMAANIYSYRSFERSSNHMFGRHFQKFHLPQLKKDFHLVDRKETERLSLNPEKTFD